MAEWKKIVVSGSDISQLNNDANYLVVTDTIDSASVAARATTLSADATASFADRATSASIADSLSQLATASYAVTASHALNVPDTASHALTAVTASIADELSGLATASFALVAGAARNADSASVAARATELSADATASFADRATTASFADLASDARTADSASVAARATELSADATASFADLAGTVHDGNITAAKLATNAVTTDKITDGNVTNAKLANDSVTIGTTEIDLGTTATSLEGLTSISALTGSFVLQIFESSSTIITSGSNIFGDAQNDIQQFTGSILQTGSMTTTGTITADKVVSDKFSGSFSGSFQGDGSGLTGLATVLTVDGDTGTQDVDLIADDLQIIGTTNEIETAVTKVGTDVKVTIGLPANITVTASFADRATSASIADLASTLSPTATASFADTATSASIANSATSASATVAGVLFPTTDGIAGQAIVTDGAGTFTYGDIFGTGSTAKLNQQVAAATWSFQHNLDEAYPIVQAYDSTGDQLIPERIETVDANNVRLYFTTATAGVAAAMVGGMGISASFAVTASHVIQATSASIADSLSGLATASFADSASFARLALEGSGSFSGSFEGDGSNLTGIATVLTIDGDSGGSSTVNLKTQTLDIAGTAGEIETSVAGQTITIGLPTSTTIDTLTVSNNATIAGNLTVGGSLVSASSLEVADQFIILASGSTSAIDGGIIVNQTNAANGQGAGLGYDASADRWALQTTINGNATSITPDAYVGVIQESAGTPSSDPVYGGTSGKGTIFVDTSNNEAYIYI